MLLQTAADVISHAALVTPSLLYKGCFRLRHEYYSVTVFTVLFFFSHVVSTVQYSRFIVCNVMCSYDLNRWNSDPNLLFESNIWTGGGGGVIWVLTGYVSACCVLHSSVRRAVLRNSRTLNFVKIFTESRKSVCWPGRLLRGYSHQKFCRDRMVMVQLL
jgi:hypothetical protein